MEENFFITIFIASYLFSRFREELFAFDEVEMSEDTLQVVEPYTKKPHFARGFMEKKTSNLALDSLVMWVCGVVK